MSKHPQCPECLGSFWGGDCTGPGELCPACHRERFGALEAQIAEQGTELSRLREIVAKLPKTADGVPVVQGDGPFWAVIFGRVVETSCMYWDKVDDNKPECLPIARMYWHVVEGSKHPGWLDEQGRRLTRVVQDCYSTRATAEAAAKEKA